MDNIDPGLEIVSATCLGFRLGIPQQGSSGVKPLQHRASVLLCQPPTEASQTALPPNPPFCREQGALPTLPATAEHLEMLHLYHNNHPSEGTLPDETVTTSNPLVLC